MKMKIFDIALVMALAIGAIVSVVSFESACKGIRSEVLRLHVIADSDSDEAQRLKLKVRDAILEERGVVFANADNLEQAKKITEENLSDIEKIAVNTLKKEGCDLSVTVKAEKSYFPTRTYGDITLPAGRYDALKVIIGEGRGQNWWCVMFPPMCLTAAQEKEVMTDVLSGGEMKIVTSNPEYEVRFWIVEKYWEIRTRLSDG